MDNLLAILLKLIVEAISPVLRKELEKLVERLKEVAKGTNNPYDDILVLFISKMLGFE